MRQVSILSALLLLLSPLLALADPETTYLSTSTTTVIVTLSSLTAVHTVTATATTTSSSTSGLTNPSDSGKAQVYPASSSNQTNSYSSGHASGNGTGSAQPSGGHVSPILPYMGAANSNDGSFGVAMLAGCIVAALGAAL